MNLHEAKAVIASYLVGRRVPRADLEEACRELRGDGDYLRALWWRVGLLPDRVDRCDATRSRVAEFSELTHGEREREMPEMVEHLAGCISCRRSYWAVQPAWVSTAIAGLREGVKDVGRRLTEGIRLVLDGTSRLVEALSGPTPVVPHFVDGTLAGQEEEDRQEWVLQDSETGFAVRLVIGVLDSGEACLTCAVEGEGAPPPGEIRIELCRSEGGALHHASRLSDVQSEPLIVTPGTWRVFLHLAQGAKTPFYEIPIEIEGKEEVRES